MSALKVVRVEDIERSNTEDFPKSTPRENTTQSKSVHLQMMLSMQVLSNKYHTIFNSVRNIFKEQM